MQCRDFAYTPPEHLIAQHPAPTRSESRLLHLDRDSGSVADHRFTDLPALLRAGDLLVFNDTRVVPARLFGRKDSGGRVEMLLERILDTHAALVQIRASKPPRAGTRLVLEGKDGCGPMSVAVRTVAHSLYQDPVSQDAFYEVEFSAPAHEVLEVIGHTPLPPYIGRPDEPADRHRYQTIYARRRGSVAAPTAGLHFDAALMAALERRGMAMGYLTLHIGAGTFRPLRVERVEAHRMHRESVEIGEPLCRLVADTRRRGGRVVAVGTTSVRALETASMAGELRPFRGDTELFMYPGHRFRSVDALVTNFHLSGSTLLILVSAFAGRERVLAAYQHAVGSGYRFYSYGDAMFIDGHAL
ncbi:MAG: tRNA preQ1(34) S-adenosylmethionine ribosyltransferase-isomerase QueA [Gammaproteobacteria bacterium]|nr:tRNA preQ1(34) S-adenosylmethionine ribosyltransferase-isomerase QueA [Gammaproteobacteria bacterium]